MASAEILVDHFLAMDPGNVTTKISGIETREPAFNLPALWIPDSQREEAMLAGYTVVDPATVIATHLTEVFKRHLGDFLDRQAVQGLLDTVAKHSPKAVEDLVPNVLPLGVVQKVLQLLVRENVSVRDMLTIVETLGDFGGGVKNPETLGEYVREKLSRAIVRPIAGPRMGTFATNSVKGCVPNPSPGHQRTARAIRVTTWKPLLQDSGCLN